MQSDSRFPRIVGFEIEANDGPGEDSGTLTMLLDTVPTPEWTAVFMEGLQKLCAPWTAVGSIAAARVQLKGRLPSPRRTTMALRTLAEEATTTCMTARLAAQETISPSYP